MIAIRPATAADLARLKARWLPAAWRLAMVQQARWPTYALEDGDGVVACATVRHGGGEDEVALIVADRARGTAAGRRLTLALARMRARLPADARIVIGVRPGHATGERLARLLGFRDTGPWPGFPQVPYRRWVLDRSRDGRSPGDRSTIDRAEGAVPLADHRTEDL